MREASGQYNVTVGLSEVTSVESDVMAECE